jgi:hypothetical protein
MILRILLIIGLAISFSGCGTKSDLLTPAGKETPKSDKDPSRPPQPIGR